MDRAEKEPPPKRRKSTGDRSPSHPKSPQHTPKRSLPRDGRSSTENPPWLRNVTGITLPPGKFTLRAEKQSTISGIERQWETVAGVQSCSRQAVDRGWEEPFDFSVMSYNILSQELLHDNAYLYRHCSLPILDWSYRFSNILKELEQHNADVICLQEVQEDHYMNQIKPSLESLGYHCEFKRRTGRKPDGCAVVFKKSRFSLVSCHPVEYFRRSVPLLDRDNVGLILLLQPTECSSCASNICVANTHLLYNPRRGDIKLAQLAMLLAEISRVAALPDGGTCPVVLCGDFNSVPWSPLYSFIKDSRLEYGGMAIGKVSGQEESPRGQRVLTVPIWPRSLGITQQCQYESPPRELSVRELEEEALEMLNSLTQPRIEHGLKLSSVYSHHLDEGKRPEITTCHSRTAITVDYIFYTAAEEGVSALPECTAPVGQGLQLLARLALVGETELQEVNGLPNEHHSSDHLPLLARFRLHK
ncbi:protein angel homolog 2 [Chanos chanos]|uniref:Protein angel homolog 2 n=1 Tax=Chanos chanos TaxID=29144 RepID=A0A6J2V6U0_CHACN|nr:protein angel homolog 2 [Chanos chanos]